MNRRSFFTKAALFVAGCQLALKCSADIELPIPDTKPIKDKRLVLNPNYSKAPYEIAFIGSVKDFNPVMIKRSEPRPVNIATVSWPIRMNVKGEYVRPFIEQSKLS